MTDDDFKAQVGLLISSNEERERWMADPVLNLCASIGIERSRVSNCRAPSDSYGYQMQRFDALVDALSRIVMHTNAPRPWSQVLDAINNGPVWRSEAWSVAVRTANALGKGVR